MIIPPIGGLGASLTGTEALTQSTPSTQAEGLAAQGATSSGTQPAEGAGSTTPSFGNALTEAISSLEGGQQSASAASQALATGTVSDPESAVTTVEDAALEMQLAAQIRGKATEAVQTIFQTQV